MLHREIPANTASGRNPELRAVVKSLIRFLLSRFLIICPGFQTQALVCSQSEHDKIRRKQPRESKLSIIQYPYNPSHSHIDTLTLDELNQTILYLKG